MTRRFAPLYVLANFGAHVAFMPLLVLLLPRRVETISPENSLVLLSQLLLLGGVTASLAHIASGAFSDRWLARAGNRRVPIAIGLVCLLGSYAFFADARTATALVVAIVTFQLSLNLMFAPLGALLADHIEHQRKGWIAGWLNMGLPLSGLVITSIGYVSALDAAWPFGLIAGVIAMSVLPLIIGWPRNLPLITATEAIDAGVRLPRRDFALAWIARLAIQSGAAIILSYLYLYVDTLARHAKDYPEISTSSGVATLSLIATIMSLGAGILAGRWSDRIGRRRLPLMLTALVVGGAFPLLAFAQDWWIILFAYALFTAGLTAFLSVDSAMIAQMLAGHVKRGALLGLMNLTNTLPAVIAPALALLLTNLDLGGRTLQLLLVIATIAALIATTSVSMIRSIK